MICMRFEYGLLHDDHNEIGDSILKSDFLLSLEELALQGHLPEAFSEEVLRAAAPEVPVVPRNRHHHFTVLFVVRKHPLETIAQPQKVLRIADL